MELDQPSLERAAEELLAEVEQLELAPEPLLAVESAEELVLDGDKVQATFDTDQVGFVMGLRHNFVRFL